MKFELKKPDAGMLLSIGSVAIGVIGALVNSEKDKRDKSKAIDEAADKAYKKVMEQMSSKN